MLTFVRSKRLGYGAPMLMARRATSRLVLCIILCSAPWLACGPPKPETCSASNCSHGCCDSNGQCRSAGSDVECGSNGATCAVCGTGSSCTNNQCVAADSGTTIIDAGTFDAGAPVVDSGTPVVDAGTSVVDSGTPDDAGTPVVDSGTPGVDAGAPVIDSGTPEVDSGVIDSGMAFDAGQPDSGTSFDSGVVDAGTQNCRMIGTWPIAGSFRAYGRTDDGGLEHALADHYSVSSAPFDTLEIDVYWAFGGRPTAVAIPSVRNLALEPNYSTCTSCVIIRENCPTFDTCQATYLARAGSVSLEEITRDVHGNFKASLSNVRFDAWRLGPDMKEPDGGCIFLGSSTFDVSN